MHFFALCQQVKGNFGNSSALTWCNYKTKRKRNTSTAKTLTDRATSQLLATEWDRPEDGLPWTFSRYDLVYYYYGLSLVVRLSLIFKLSSISFLLLFFPTSLWSFFLSVFSVCVCLLSRTKTMRTWLFRRASCHPRWMSRPDPFMCGAFTAVAKNLKRSGPLSSPWATSIICAVPIATLPAPTNIQQHSGPDNSSSKFTGIKLNLLRLFFAKWN